MNEPRSTHDNVTSDCNVCTHCSMVFQISCSCAKSRSWEPNTKGDVDRVLEVLKKLEEK